MTKISLKEAFNSYFHDKYSFTDFLTLNISTQYDNIFHSKNTFSPNQKLKKYQQFLNEFIFDFMKINKDIVFSYRKGVSNYDAVYPHRNKKYILSTDIKSFFLNIDEQKVQELILSNKENYSIIAKDVEKYIDILTNLVTYKGVLPVGAPTSPKISNAYLFSFDNAMQTYCREHQIIYTRYSDDFIFSANKREPLSNTLAVVKNTFMTNGFDKFELNDTKTKIQIRGSKVSLLGLIITPNGHITVDKNIKKNIEILFHFYLTNRIKYKDFLDSVYMPKNANTTALDKVSGILNYIYPIDRKFIDKLKKKYGNYIVKSFMDRSIND